MRRLILLIASILVSGIFLWLAVRDVPVGEVIDSLRQANLLWWLVSLTFIFLGLWFRAIRWRGLVDKRIPLKEAFHIMNITFLMNLLPFRAGEIARSLLATRSGVPVVTAATSIVVERLLDTVLVVILLATALSQLSEVPSEVSQTATIFGILAVMGFIVLLLFARFPTIPRLIIQRLNQWIPILKRFPLEQLLENVLEGLLPLTHLPSFLHSVTWTILSWITSYISLYALFMALNVENINLAVSIALALALASFSIAIPLSIAAVGPFEAAIVLTGEIVGMNEITAVSLGFLFHGTTIIAYAIWGTIGLLVMGVSLGELLDAKEKPKENPENLEFE